MSSRAQITIGAVVTAGTEAYTIADLSTVWMMASVNETDTGKLRIGLPAEVRVEAFPDVRFPGSVTYLGSELDPTTRTLQVRVLVPNPGQRFAPEMYANAKFPEPQTRASRVPAGRSSAGSERQHGRLRRKNGDEFEARPVKLGKRDAGEVEVDRGCEDRGAGGGERRLSAEIADAAQARSKAGELKRACIAFS